MRIQSSPDSHPGDDHIMCVVLLEEPLTFQIPQIEGLGSFRYSAAENQDLGIVAIIRITEL